MQYRNDEKAGQRLSALGMGCMRFPRRAGQIDLDKTEEMLKSAVERGVNFFDTAYVYGGSEGALGEVFQRCPGLREKMNIATKLPFHLVKSYEDFDRYLNASMERMRIDFVDYYLVHNINYAADWETLCGLGIERWIAEQKAQGRIRQIGFSFHGSQVDFLKVLEMYDWEFTLIQYNYADENFQAGRVGLEKAAEKGMPVFIMEPLLGGRLATGLPKQAAALFEQAAPGRSAANWAIRWLLDQPEVTLVLSGMSSMDNLDDNIKATNEAQAGCVTEAEREIYAKVVEILRRAYKNPCTGCNYCLPCPKGVNIPGALAAYNASYAVDLYTGFAQYATSTSYYNAASNSSARKCNGCGLCIKRCPQRIDIPAQLKRAARRLEPAPVRWGARVVRKLQR